MLVQAQKSLLLGRIQFHRFGGGQSACHPSLPGSCTALLAQFEFQLGDRGRAGALLLSPGHADLTMLWPSWQEMLGSAVRKVQ